MSENKRYYWFKMKKDFFETKTMRYILSLENGHTLVTVLIKLMLLSLETGGYTKKENIYLTFEQEIAMSISEKEKDVKELLEIATNLNLIEKIDDETYYINVLNENIGSETDYAVKKREIRKRQEKDNFETMSGHCPTDIDIDKDIDIDIEKENATPSFSKKKGGVENEKNNYFYNNRFNNRQAKSSYRPKSGINSHKPSYDLEAVKREIEMEELVYKPRKRNDEYKKE